MTNNGTTVEFSDKDGLFIFTVKKEFLEKCPNPSQVGIEELVTKHDFKNFLHNPTGPAVRYGQKIPNEVREALLKNESVKNVDGNPGTYWLNGQLLTGAELEKLKHDVEFGDKFEDMLSQAVSK